MKGWFLTASQQMNPSPILHCIHSSPFISHLSIEITSKYAEWFRKHFAEPFRGTAKFAANEPLGDMEIR